MDIAVRRAVAADDAVLDRLDTAAWSDDANVVPRPTAGESFFGERTRPEDVLVAELDGEVVGYVTVRRPTTLASNSHVQQIQGLAVAPEHRRRGIGRVLVEAAVDEARRRGARKITLRVLGSNPDAMRLYRACGFEIEGALREEFFVGGRYVDDWAMARQLLSAQVEGGTRPDCG